MKFILASILLGFSVAQANVVGVDTQNFNPTTNGLDFVTVHSSKTLSPGVLNFGMFFNYAINTLPNYEDTITQTRAEPRDALTSMDLNMGIGLMNNWDIGISIPQVLYQSVDEDSTTFHGQFENTGLTEIRLNTKYRFWDGNSQGMAVIASANIFLIENYPFTGTDPGPSYNFELAYDNTFNKFTWGVNVGYRIRNAGEPIPNVPVAPFPNQYLASVAGSYYFSDWDFKMIAEIYSSFPAEQTQFSSDRELSTAELLIGGKFDLSYNIAAHVGVATELIHGTASPDYRIYAGLNWSMGPVFGSKDPAPASDYYIEEETEEVLETKSFVYIDDADAFKAEAPTGDEKFLARNVLFEFNGHQVSPQFHTYLQKLADYLLKGQVFQQLVIIGHTDSVGSDEYNMQLSIKRANAVKLALQQYLPEEHRDKVSAEGEGERSPIASNKNFQGRALNRRVEFFIKR